MNQSEFVALFEKTIEAHPGSVQYDQPLAAVVEWDSVSVLTFIAMVDEKFGMQLSGKVISDSTTVADLAALLGDRVSA